MLRFPLWIRANEVPAVRVDDRIEHMFDSDPSALDPGLILTATADTTRSLNLLEARKPRTRLRLGRRQLLPV